MPSHVPSTTFQRPSLDVSFGDGWAVRCAVAGHSRNCACHDPPSDLAGVLADSTVESSDDPQQGATDEVEEMLESETVLRGRLPSGGVQQQQGAMDDGELAQVCLKQKVLPAFNRASSQLVMYDTFLTAQESERGHGGWGASPSL